MCFIWLKSYTSTKLQPKYVPCVFLGYSTTQSGFKCLDPSTGQVYISRHVCFVGDMFPFSQVCGTHDRSPIVVRKESQYPPSISYPIFFPNTLSNPTSIHVPLTKPQALPSPHSPGLGDNFSTVTTNPTSHTPPPKPYADHAPNDQPKPPEPHIDPTPNIPSS